MPPYLCALTTTLGKWQEHRLPVKDSLLTFRGRIPTDVLPLDATRGASVGFRIWDKQAGAFRLELDSIHAA